MVIVQRFYLSLIKYIETYTFINTFLLRIITGIHYLFLFQQNTL